MFDCNIKSEVQWKKRSRSAFHGLLNNSDNEYDITDDHHLGHHEDCTDCLDNECADDDGDEDDGDGDGDEDEFMSNHY